MAGSTNYTFGASGDYIFDNNYIEVTGSASRLKSQQYTGSEANTSALWHFDESEGGSAETTADDSHPTNNNDITLSTTSPCNTDGGAFGAGKINNAITFDGVPNCATAADSSSLSVSGVNPSMTIEALVKFPNAFDADADVRQAIVDKGNYRMYFSESDGKLKFELHDSAAKTWNKVGGSNTTNLLTTEGLNGGWRQLIPGTVFNLIEYNSALYIGTYTTVGNAGGAEVWKYSGSGTAWTKVAGDGTLNDQWDNVTFEGVMSMVVHGGKLYIGLGFGTGDGELWEYDDSPEALTRFRAFTNAEEVVSLASDGTNLYAGLGVTASDADVWMYSGSTWTQIGGNEVHATKPNWNTGYERVRSLTVMGGVLYAGLGDTAAEAEVWRYDTTTWTKVGGDGVGSSWAAASNFEYVYSMAANGTTLYAGLGSTASDADVWECTGCGGGSPSWTQIGGNEVHGSIPNWNTNYETVRNLLVVGGTLYASIGDTAGEAEVWRYDTTTWTKVGGDGTNTSWDASFTNPAGVTNTKEQAYLGSFSGDLVVGTGTTPQDAEVWRCTSCGTSPSWAWIGGRDFSSWGAAQMSQVGTITTHNGKLYVGFGIATKHAVLWQYDGTSWSQLGGGGINGSNWEHYEFIRSLATFEGDLYAGFGDTAGDADVWKWDGATWTKIGGDGNDGSWNAAHEYVASLVSDGSYLYAGLGASASDADVWRYDPAGSPNKWTQIGGNEAHATIPNWNTGFDVAWQMAVYGSKLFVGLGVTAGEAEVWRFDTTSWTKVGGDGVGSGASWNGAGDLVRETIRSMTFLGTSLYVGIGDTADEATVSDAEVWQCTNCADTAATPAWTQIGGDGLNSGWNDTDFEWVNGMVTYNGELYAALGSDAGDAEVWRYDGSVWAKVGGDGVGTPTSWSTNYESVNGLTVYKGRLFAGLGNTNNAATASDGEVWEYGGNTARVIESSQSSWAAETWYHIAGVYDGAAGNGKIYVNGVQNGSTETFAVTLADNAQTLSVGNLKGPFTTDGPFGSINGTIDELRISNAARSSFVMTHYITTDQTIRPVAAVPRTGVLEWSGFDATETPNGGTIRYRLSDDNGTTWKYFSGGSWVASSGVSYNNTESDVNANIGDFPVTSSGLLWQGVLTGNGDQQVTLDAVTVSWSDDLTDPTNPSGLFSAKNALGGTVDLTTNTWYNYAAPSFVWNAGTDAGSGVDGYYVYFGTSSSANPESTSGIINSGGAVQFQSGTTLTLSSSMTNGQTYYLLVKTRDLAGNITDAAVSLFTYKYDNLAPTPPDIISVSPSGYSSTNSYTFLWPSTGSSAAEDVGAPTQGSGILGYQYKTGASSGSFSDWSALTTDTTVVLADGAYQEGVNTFELRVVDVAGNISSTVTASYYYAGSAPSGPENLTVTPVTDASTPTTDNSFAFAWDEPAFFNGSIRRYHFSINKLPTNTNTSTTTLRQLSAGPYATQQGKNSFYVVAEDEAGNVNYNTYSTVDFYTITPAPEAPTAVQIFDISNRDTQEYAISMKWTEPASKASGFDGYEVYRSEDNITYESAGTTKSPVFVDTNLDSKIYYFYVKSKDNAGQYSVASSSVSLTPTGRYTTAPVLEDGPNMDPSAFAAAVDWETDRIASSFVEFGTKQDKLGKENGGDTIGTLDLVEKHEVTLSGLEPETVYYYQTVWVDQDGNQGRSDLLSFETNLRPKISDVKVSNVTLTAATVSWTTTTVSTSSISYGPTKSFGTSIEDTSGSQTTRHSVRIEDLLDSTTYYFLITGTDVDGNVLASDEYSFTTLTKPAIADLTFEPIKDAATTSMRVNWTTNVPTTSVVLYALEGGASLTLSQPEYVTEHELILDALAENAKYAITARSTDQYGNTVSSDTNSVATPDDSRPPKVSNLTIEVRSTGSGEAQRAQLIISWDTDEPSSSQVEYGPGISSDSYPSKTQEDSALTGSHTVIVPELEPAKLYHLRAVSRDRAGNAGLSSDTTAITGKAQRSVIDIIITTLQQSLSFLGNIPGLTQQ